MDTPITHHVPKNNPNAPATCGEPSPRAISFEIEAVDCEVCQREHEISRITTAAVRHEARKMWS